MKYAIEGIVLGLTLSILIGPIFVALTQTGIQKGIRAGIVVGLGIWFSDILVIAGSYFFIREIETLTQNLSFHFWMGLIGGLILMISGVITFFNKVNDNINVEAYSAKTSFGYFSKGFLVNFVNPFTFVFWLGIMTTYVIGDHLSGQESLILFGSIILTIMTTDMLKIVLAKLIRQWMSPTHIQTISKIAGILLFIFGLALLVRTNWM